MHRLKRNVFLQVNFSEPLSFLQRLTEDFEYSDILDRAAQVRIVIA